MPLFNIYAHYYNLLYKDKNYQKEVEYIDILIKKYSYINVKTILDLGCGTGKHDALLAEKNYQLTGVDISENMIDIAKNENKKLDLKVGDVRNVNFKKKFDAVISLFHVASYLTINEDFENYLKTAFKHLNPGGVFIFDFWYGPAVLNDKPIIRIKRLENDKLKLIRISEPEIHENENIVDVNFEILIEEKKTKQLEIIRETHKMRYFFLPELELMVKHVGFNVLDVFEWLSESEICIKSWYGIIILRK